MKVFKKTLCVFLSVCILFLAVTLPAYADSEQRFGKSILSKMDNSAALIYVYDKLVEGIKNSTANISISHTKHKVNWDEVTVVYRALHNDYPEYFWINGACTGNVNSLTDVALSITPTYTMSGSALQNAKNAFNSKVNSMLVGLDGKSDYEKSLILHDRLIDATDYVYTDNDQNAYGALVEGKAVCAGYTRAYQHLMNKAGLSAWYVSGTSINPTTNQNENHAWNLVKVGGNWYYTDVTWDDQDDDIFHAYFNITTKQINEDHTAGDFGEYLPDATATTDNYFVKNNLVFTSEVDAQRIAALLKNDENNSAHIYTSGSVDTFEKNIKSNISKIVKEMGVPSYMHYSYNITILGREFILSFKFIEKDHRHNPTVVAAKQPTCSSLGNTEYYSCFCGKWFTDATAATEITDKSSVNIAVVPHTPSGYKYNANNHWKICTVCNAEIANSNVPHTDKDKNGKCDSCGAKVDLVVSTPSKTTQSSNGSNDNIDNNNNNATDSSDKNGNQTSQTTPYVNLGKVGHFTKYFLYIGGTVMVIILAVSVTVILKRKK